MPKLDMNGLCGSYDISSLSIVINECLSYILNCRYSVQVHMIGDSASLYLTSCSFNGVRHANVILQSLRNSLWKFRCPSTGTFCLTGAKRGPPYTAILSV